jgi:serine kinase of HPr protein (carbohydrate metabolism regulator)
MNATIHASAALVAGKGVLIRGVSGAGKSSLLLALMTAAGAMLVSDDRVELEAEDGGLVARAPDAIAGLMEVRGVGIVRKPHAPSAMIDLVVDLLPLAECPRMPDPPTVTLCGAAVPRIFVAIGTHDGVARVTAALARTKAEIYS